MMRVILLITRRVYWQILLRDVLMPEFLSENSGENKLKSLMIICLSLLSLNVLCKKLIIKTPIAFNSKLPGLGTTIAYVKKRVESASNGEIVLKLYEPGKLVPTFEILETVSSGKVQAGYAIAGYWQGEIPAAAVFSSLPFGPEAGEFMAWLTFGNGGKLYQEMYDTHHKNVKVFPCGILPPETSGWYTKEINTVSDLKGLKIRFFGLGGAVMKKLGASPSQIPGSEIFPALEKKALDATEYSMPAIDEKLGFYKVAKYNYFPGWHQQATVFELLINKEVWGKMSPDKQELISMACNDANAYAIAEGEALQFQAMKRLKDKGVIFKKWPKHMLDAFEGAWNEVVVELKGKDAFFKKAIEDLEKFRSDYKIWKDHAYLPRNR